MLKSCGKRCSLQARRKGIAGQITLRTTGAQQIVGRIHRRAPVGPARSSACLSRRDHRLQSHPMRIRQITCKPVPGSLGRLTTRPSGSRAHHPFGDRESRYLPNARQPLRRSFCMGLATRLVRSDQVDGPSTPSFSRLRRGRSRSGVGWCLRGIELQLTARQLFDFLFNRNGDASGAVFFGGGLLSRRQVRKHSYSFLCTKPASRHDPRWNR
jgi:hypothetical protein